MAALQELGELISRHAVDGYQRTAVDGLTVMASSGPTPPHPAVSRPTLAVVAQGGKRTVLNERHFDYGAGSFLIVSVELPITGYITRASAGEPFLCVTMELKPAVIASLLLETSSADRGTAGPAGIVVSESPPELLDAMVRLLRLVDRPTDRPVLAPMVEREILWRLITGEQGATVRQIGLADSSLSQVSRTIRWIREHYAQPMRVDDLARLASMSVSSFHRHFRAVTEMSPIQFQKRIRLQEARLRLMAGPGDIADVGFAVGYDSPSQFSREYRRLYGEPPGRDVERLRDLTPMDGYLAR